MLINTILAHKEECKRIALAKPDERILTHVSNFRPVKRVEDVIQIFNQVQQEIPSKLLMVVMVLISKKQKT